MVQKLSVFLLCFLFGTAFYLSAHAQQETQRFSIEGSYDLFGRKEIDATLVRSDKFVYFYAEAGWWQSRSATEQNDLRIALAELGLEFGNRIYPVLTSTFGSEQNPGVDGDPKITVLVHQMGGEAGGYIRTGDAYERALSPTSNEREMVYLNSKYIGTSEAKSFLAHEFTHVITINQKDILRRVSEEVWLNEARAEYASTLLGYDNAYTGSNLERRVKDFLSEPSNALTDWLNRQEDYGVANLFIQYVVDQYGLQVLVDSLHSSQVGTVSLNDAFKKNGFQKTVDQTFEDWSVAVLVNNCSLGEQYCYKNKNLSNLRVTPILYFLPKVETVFSTYHTTFPWSANWHRLVGGGQKLTIQFTGQGLGVFRVPYVLCNTNEECSVEFFSLSEDQKADITLSEFGSAYSSVTLIPFIAVDEKNTLNSQGNSFSWEVSTQQDFSGEGETIVQGLLARIAQLQEQIRQLQTQLASAGRQEGGTAVSCNQFTSNLSFGQRGEEVRCLQEFLAAQGPDVYPEGLVTGNFLALTKQAVIRFQEKYLLDILAPVGEQRGTGYVGQMTRNKINQLLGALVAL